MSQHDQIGFEWSFKLAGPRPEHHTLIDPRNTFPFI
jgi:hypothetical protein